MKFKYLLACTAICAAFSANAGDAIDFGEMQPDTAYEYQAMVPAMGYYTPTKTGVMVCYSTGEVITPYEEEGHVNALVSSNSYYGPSGEKVRTYNVTEGKTIYFYAGFPLDGGTFRFAIDNQELTLSYVDPAEGNTPISIITNFRVTIAFSIPVKYTKCMLSVNDTQIEMTPQVLNSYIEVNWFNTLRQLYREGKINAGDELTLTFTGIRDANDASNRPDFGYGVGKLILKYKMAGKPAELIWQSGTPESGMTDFLTYYLPGSNEGIVSLTFSEPLDPNCHPTAEVAYGDRDNIELGMYFDHPPVTIEGKTCSVNLQGVTRFPEQMVPGLAAQPNISLTITGIKSADGQYVMTGYTSSPYSFGYSYNLKSVVYSIAADWLPLSGSELNSGDPMEIWVMNGQKIIFDSVDFSYIKNGEPAMVSVPYSDLKATEDIEDAMLYNLNAPAIDSDPNSEIVVTLGGLLCADGLDHSTDILVKYKSSTSAVETIEVEESDNVYFDLTGRRIAAPTKGIYIHNGKKAIVK